MSDLLLQHWWMMLIALPLLVFIVNRPAKGSREQPASSLARAPLQFGLAAIVCIWGILGVCLADGKWNIIHDASLALPLKMAVALSVPLGLFCFVVPKLPFERTRICRMADDELSRHLRRSRELQWLVLLAGPVAFFTLWDLLLRLDDPFSRQLLTVSFTVPILGAYPMFFLIRTRSRFVQKEIKRRQSERSATGP